MRVRTNISKKDIQFVENLTDETHDYFKYCCPICLRYFNTILVGTCCKNYICRLCIGEMAKTAKKDPKYTIRCAYCAQDDFKLFDVDIDAEVRQYTDTPAKIQLNRIEVAR